jgi:hypothetical protein
MDKYSFARGVLSSWMFNRSNGTYVEGVKDTDEVLLPRSNLALIPLGEDESMDRAQFTLADDLPLDLGQSSAIEKVGKWNTLRARYRSGSRSQLHRGPTG